MLDINVMAESADLHAEPFPIKPSPFHLPCKALTSVWQMRRGMQLIVAQDVCVAEESCDTHGSK